MRSQWNILAMNMVMFKKRTESLESRRSITWLGLKAIIYQKKFWHLPNSLNEVIGNVPIDPYTGKSYVYSKLPDGFIIYGVGSDGKDDGGNPETDIVWNCKM